MVALAKCSMRLMIVDDDADAGNSLGLLLRCLGYETVVHQSGYDALRSIDSFAPDALILDLSMPLMNGFELARRVRASPAWGRLPLIAVTAHGLDEYGDIAKR